MGTETRIGITAGLLIVIAASVYFFYGSDRTEDDLTITIGTPASTAPKIPPTGAARTAGLRDTAKHAAAERSRVKSKPAPPLAKGKIDRSDKPRSTRKNAVMPGRGTGTALARSDHPVQPRVTLPAVNQPTGKRVAEDRTSRSPTTPAPTTHRPQTRLRTGPSTGLIDATRKNLRPNGADQTPPVTPQAKSKGSPPLTREKTKREKTRPDVSDPSKVSGRTDRSVSRDRGVRPRVPSSVDTASGENGRPSRVRTIIKRPSPTTSPKGKWPKRHRVSFDETLSGISLRYYDTSTMVDQILKANPRVRDPRRLKPGEVLVIPAPEKIDSSSSAANGPSTRRAASKQPGRVYLVQHGDSFYSIARKMLGDATRWEELFKNNREMVKNDPKRLRPGMRITLPETNREKSKNQKVKKSK